MEKEMTLQKSVLQEYDRELELVQRHVLDLFWEYDRMSSSGQSSLNKLAKLVEVPTEMEIQKDWKQYMADTA
tara:strand:+ start:369 stop:584 length:216 start_codon:yes stop_codon:yes gene_type:complete